MPETRRIKKNIDTTHRVPRGVVFGYRGKISAILVLVGIFLVSYSVWGKMIRVGIPAPVISPIVNKTTPAPVQISIPSLGIAAAVTELGLNPDRTLATPKDSREVGWYTGSVAPGANGPAVMVGHLDSTFGPAVFYHLNQIKLGDSIRIVRKDGSRAIFQVVDKQTYPQNDFPTDKVYGAIDYQGLRLITCYGTYSRVVGHYSDNLVVYAALVSIEN